MKNIALVSLGCAKNQVNLEEMRFLLEEAGFIIVENPEGADLALVNTCGFIDSAKTEAIGHIVALGELKQEKQLGHIIVTGCLSQRYETEIFNELPEVDGVLGTGSYHQIVDAVKRVVAGEKVALFGDIHAKLEKTKRSITNSPAWAYLKIAEGCDNNCSYCVIPSLRGNFRSRTLDSLLEEATELTESGVKELILVAQDITQYGKDQAGQGDLAQLITKLAEIPGLQWIRLHYLYPDGVEDELIKTIANTPKVLPYLDIPIQHIDDTILENMNRRGDSLYIANLFAKLRSEIPHIVLRTSIITGLPGEGEEEFETLANFLRNTKLERVGVFPYSPQEGTPAYTMEKRPDLEVAEHRAMLLQDIQGNILDDFLESRIGNKETVLCIGKDPEMGLYFGRSFAESPEIDGVIWLNSDKELQLGDFYQVQYTGILQGELEGKVEE